VFFAASQAKLASAFRCLFGNADVAAQDDNRDDKADSKG
jgi:hypothetical protein